MDIEDIKKIVFDVLKEAGLAVDAVDGKAAVVEAVKREVAEDKLDRLEDEAEMKAAEALVESAAKDEVKNAACGEVKDEVKDEVKNEVCDEAKDEVKDEVKEEVIKAEVLNQKPTIGLAARGDADKWRSMNHTEFMKYIESGAYKKDL